MHLDQGRTLKSLANEFGVSVSTIGRWVIRYRNLKPKENKAFRYCRLSTLIEETLRDEPNTTDKELPKNHTVLPSRVSCEDKKSHSEEG